MALISPSFSSSSSSSCSNLTTLFIIPFNITFCNSIFKSYCSCTMDMYANGSSYGSASLTLQTSNSFRDVSFSSYLNQAEEQVIRKLTNQASDPTNDHRFRDKSEEDDDEDEELGVFGAEKYFKAEIEDVESKDDDRLDNRFVTGTTMDETVEQFDHRLGVTVTTDQTNTHTPSVRSNASCNSRTGLLPRSKPAPERTKRTRTRTGTRTRTFLATFGCNCIDKKSTQVTEKRLILARDQSKPQIKLIPFHHQTDPLSSKLTDYSTERLSRNDYFSFPVLNSTDLNSNYSRNSNNSSSDRSNTKFVNLAGKDEGNGKNGCRLSLGKKLSLLNDWDADSENDISDEMYIPSSGMYNKDVDSDSSSDLFEIESISTTENNSFVAPRKSNGYAPSEVSVDWSVVTASAADFSVVSDYEEVRTGGGGGGWRYSGGNDTVNKDEQKKQPGILSGCTSHKAVRVAGNGYKVGGGGVAGRRWLSESMAVGSMFRGGII